MKIPALQALLAEEADAFEQYAAPFAETTFADRPGGRWSVGDTAQHLFLSARPVSRLMTGPRHVFGQWGTINRPSRSYDVTKEMYQQALEKGIKAPPTMSPRPDDVAADKATMIARLTETYLALAGQLAHWAEDELDQYQIPHPALGLLSVREMLYFVSIHTRHHIAVLSKQVSAVTG